MRRCGAGGRITGSEGDMVVLHRSGSRYLDPGADTVAVAADALEPQFQPVRGSRAVVEPDLRRRAQGRRHDIQTSVAIEVSGGGAAMPAGRLLRQTRFGGQCLKPHPAEVAEYGVRLFYLYLGFAGERLHVAASDEDVFPAIVVKVGDGGRVAGHGRGEPCHIAGACHVGKPTLAQAAEQRKSLSVE